MAENENKKGLVSGLFELFRQIVSGDFLMMEFLRKQYGVLLLIAALAFVYIDNQFYCDNQRKKIATLQDEIKEEKYKLLTMSSEQTKKSRQSNVKRMLEERNIPLTENQEPAIDLN